MRIKKSKKIFFSIFLGGFLTLSCSVFQKQPPTDEECSKYCNIEDDCEEKVTDNPEEYCTNYVEENIEQLCEDYLE